ncbi:MAG: hypothetical protein ACTHYC_13540 [Sphingobacterium sp.]|uniref:hypothetical protein n=1 Tax=Sphingobacterium sp. JB170 TaxID=1434842 RepID=UPI00097EE9B2|nr:hypothetical protein [Sphingobacterium sp. JB170]SJN41364.1 membrane protein, putative [Sphingobacterium sp. JB170]
MFKTIYNFEIIQQLKRPFIWIICILMFLQGLYYMHHSGEYYANDETYANASAIFFTVFAGIGYIGFIVTAIIGGAVITKDLQARFSSIIFTTSASESGYFWGRFWAGFTIMLGLNLFYLLGAFCYSFLPIPNMGPVNFQALLMAIVYILIPNTFILYVFSFCAATITRNVRSAYLASMFIMLFMIFAVSMKDVNRAVALLDPTAFGVLEDALAHMSPAEKNNYIPSIGENLMWNRVGWLFLAIVFLWISRKRFAFKTFSKAVAGDRKKQLRDGDLPVSQSIINRDPQSAYEKPKFSFWLNWKNVFSLTLTEFRSVVSPIGFKIFLGLLLVMYICFIAVWQQQYYSVAPTLPVTVEVTNITIALSFYFLLFICINTVELLFRSQTSEFWRIADALPVPSWVTAVSKVNAMVLVSLLLCICLIVFGISVQAAKGYFNFELGVYFKEILFRWMPKYIEFILIAVAFAGITGKKYAAHSLTILVLVVTIILHEIEVLEQHRFAFAISPGSLKYTDMNGASFYSLANLWYSIYWISLSLSLALIGLLVWPRGLAASFLKRFNLKGKTSKTIAVLCLIAVCVFVYSARDIYQVVNVENEFSTKEEDRSNDADYEKKYKQYEHLLQPKIQHIDLSMNLDTDIRKFDYDAKISLVNPYSEAIQNLHVEWVDFMTIETISILGNKLELLSKDDDHRHAIYKLEKPILPGDTVVLNVTVQKQYEGFTNDDPQLDIAFNGSFMSEDFLPFIGGYDNRRELISNKYRKVYALSPFTSSLPSAEKSIDSNYSFASTQSNGFTFNAVISTSEKQQIVSPGIRVKSWKDNGKNYFQFQSEKTIPFQWHILSANYASQKQQVQIAGQAIEIEVYYHPGHPYNIDVWIESAKEALAFLNKHLEAYPYSKLVIAERPRYDEDLHTSANVMVLPENHGWIADISREEDRDYLRFVTTQLIAEQYFGTGNFARVEGFPFLTKSIPGYLALVQMNQLYGKPSVEKFLKKNHDKYLAGRATAGFKEVPLLLCDENQNYIFDHKGIEVLSNTSADIISEDMLLSVIREFYLNAKDSKEKITAIDWYNLLKKSTPDEKQKLLESQYFK